MQVNKLEITADKHLLAAGGNPHIRLYEVNSNNPQAVQTYDAHTNNVTAVCRYLLARTQLEYSALWLQTMRHFPSAQ